MKKLIEKLKEKVFRKGFWLFKRNIEDITKEAKKNWGGNESALARHIFTQWFKK